MQVIKWDDSNVQMQKRKETTFLSPALQNIIRVDKVVAKKASATLLLLAAWLLSTAKEAEVKSKVKLDPITLVLFLVVSAFCVVSRFCHLGH